MKNSLDFKVNYLFKVLSIVLLEIRKEAKENKLSKSYKLSDLTHNLPSELNLALLKENKEEFEDVFKRFELRAKASNLEFFTDNVKEMLK